MESDRKSLLQDLDEDDEESGEQLRETMADYHRNRIQLLEVELGKIDRQSGVRSIEMELGVELEEKEEEIKPQTSASEMEFCVFCGVKPTLRSHHCRECDKCVATYDHHCLCIGTCIGERNHCRFWWFLLFQSLELVYALSISLTGFQAKFKISDWFRENALALTAASLFGTLSLFIVPLFVFHTFIICGNLTTYEVGKGPDKLPYLAGTKECDLPFSNGLFLNLKRFCCLKSGIQRDDKWKPVLWKPVTRIERNSENVLENLWENKYYSCC